MASVILPVPLNVIPLAIGVHRAFKVYQSIKKIKAAGHIKDAMKKAIEMGRKRNPGNKNHNGNCSGAEKILLQAAVNAACKIKRACQQPPGGCKINKPPCEFWRNQATLNNACKKARQAINRRCFGGGNKSHRNKADEAGKTAAWCLHLIGRLCKPLQTKFL